MDCSGERGISRSNFGVICGLYRIRANLGIWVTMRLLRTFSLTSILEVAAGLHGH